MQQVQKWKTIAIIFMILSLLLGFAAIKTNRSGKAAEEQTETEQEDLSYLNLWKEDAKAKVFLEEYIEDVTDPASPNYIPLENRIAVFDLDGTLFCETDPTYFDHMLYMYRVTEDKNYQPSEFELQVAEEIQESIDTGTYPSDLFMKHGQGVASAFKGLSIPEFYNYVKEYGKTPSPGYTNMNRGDAFYLPMVEIIEYLQENDFQTCIISGTDRLIVRAALQGLDFMNIPPRQIIGSDQLLTTSSDNSTKDGLDYNFKEGDELILAGEFVLKNLKMNKVKTISQEIGVQPVLAFGNSSSDFSMASYTTSENPYRSMAFMLCCDDIERENGDITKAEKMVSSCEEYGWIPISMASDWKTIYGDEVQKIR